jgi:low affinity Fe/Cu permease
MRISTPRSEDADMTPSEHEIQIAANPPHMPSDVTGRVGFFDRFATRASQFASRAWFFAGCVLVVVLWTPTYLVVGSVDTWQLIINTLTTIVTFLMVALLQNSQTRANQAVQDKLNAIADGLADLMTATADKSPHLHDEVAELRKAVGLEDRERS